MQARPAAAWAACAQQRARPPPPPNTHTPAPHPLQAQQRGARGVQQQQLHLGPRQHERQQAAPHALRERARRRLCQHRAAPYRLREAQVADDDRGARPRPLRGRRATAQLAPAAHGLAPRLKAARRARHDLQRRGAAERGERVALGGWWRAQGGVQVAVGSATLPKAALPGAAGPSLHGALGGGNAAAWGCARMLHAGLPTCPPPYAPHASAAAP
jgi:hypothetical protein